MARGWEYQPCNSRFERSRSQRDSWNSKKAKAFATADFTLPTSLHQHRGYSMDSSAGGFSFLILWFLFLPFFSSVNASIHLYDHLVFREVGNSYLLSGGSEGIVASPTGFPARSSIMYFPFCLRSVLALLDFLISWFYVWITRMLRLIIWNWGILGLMFLYQVLFSFLFIVCFHFW